LNKETSLAVASRIAGLQLHLFDSMHRPHSIAGWLSVDPIRQVANCACLDSGRHLGDARSSLYGYSATGETRCCRARRTLISISHKPQHIPGLQRHCANAPQW
jgi:hypothetical protein